MFFVFNEFQLFNPLSKNPIHEGSLYLKIEYLILTYIEKSSYEVVRIWWQIFALNEKFLANIFSPRKIKIYRRLSESSSEVRPNKSRRKAFEPSNQLELL